jgi:hypothetical protein
MHIIVAGFLPGDIAGFEMLPIVELKSINATIDYILT